MKALLNRLFAAFLLAFKREGVVRMWLVVAYCVMIATIVSAQLIQDHSAPLR
jgi:hypothetical protein